MRLMKIETDRLGLLLHDAARAVRKRFEQRTSGLGLSSAQWRLLALVSREGPINQAWLADRLDIEPISVSRLVDRMEQAGWVSREPDPGDRRVRLIRPTPKTLSAYAEIKATAGDVYAEALAGLSPDERCILVVGLNTIITNLSVADAPSADCTVTEAKA